MEWSLAVFFVVTCCAAASGGIWKPDDWYRALNKPGWTPKDWVFPVVWTPLYCAMAMAAWLVWRSDAPGADLAIAVWGVQLALNAVWSWVFFGRKQIKLALLELAALWLAVAATILLFWPIDPIAGALLLPYLLWVTIAGALNAHVLKLNPEAAPA